MATVHEIEAAAWTLEKLYGSKNRTQTKAAAQLILESAERAKERGKFPPDGMVIEQR